MTVSQQHLDRVQFIRGSLDGLIRLAAAERFELLAYHLEMAKLEALKLQVKLSGPQ
tara:strand:- start:1006 stop:1173 length:168 start_codon:yes stop_codon:yes gene_type:complete